MKDDMLKILVISLLCIALIEAAMICGLKAKDSYQPTLYEGVIGHKDHGQIIVEVIVPVSEDDYIGLDVGDPYILQEVSK